MPAEFLIDEDLITRKAHYTSAITDFLPVEKILAWLNDKPVMRRNISPKVGMRFTHIQ